MSYIFWITLSCSMCFLNVSSQKVESFSNNSTDEDKSFPSNFTDENKTFSNNVTDEDKSFSNNSTDEDKSFSNSVTDEDKSFSNNFTDEDKFEGFENKIKLLETEIFYLKSKGAKSCEELKLKPGFDKSGEYFIDPAQTGSPIKVYCDMDLNETWISHDGEEMSPIEYCKGNGCFEKKFVYEAPDEQIDALKAISETCYQEISYGCKMAPLKHSNFGHYSGWWTDKDGSKKFYIDGDNEDLAVCGCHATSSCSLSLFNSTCNCNAVFLPLWSSDEGRVTNKDSLPVRSFVYGDFVNEQQEANITVGKLKCSGSKITAENTDGSTSCSSLKQGGASQDMYYITKQRSDQELSVSYCKMSNPGDIEEELQEESFKLNSGGDVKEIETITVSSHYSDTDYMKMAFYVCGNERDYYYHLSYVTLENATNATKFSTDDATYTISEDGLYSLIIGTFSGSCDPHYIVHVKDKFQGSEFIFGKSEKTNIFTGWMTAETTLKIMTRYAYYRSNSNFKMTIIKQF